MNPPTLYKIKNYVPKINTGNTCVMLVYKYTYRQTLEKKKKL